jgi:hypothetical protein
VVQGYAAGQILERPAEVAYHFATMVASRLDSNLNLTVQSAGLVKMWTARTSYVFSATPTGAELWAFIRPDPLGEFRSGLLASSRPMLEHFQHHGRETWGRVIRINHSTSMHRDREDRLKFEDEFTITIEFESDGVTYTLRKATSSRPRVPEGGLVLVRYCPYYPTQCAHADAR